MYSYKHLLYTFSPSEGKPFHSGPPRNGLSQRWEGRRKPVVTREGGIRIKPTDKRRTHLCMVRKD